MDISIAFDPIADIMEVAVVVILIKWIRFEKKEAKKRPRRLKPVQVTIPTVVKVDEAKDSHGGTYEPPGTDFGGA